MAYGFDFAGLFARRGELAVQRGVLRIVADVIREFGLSGYWIRTQNRVRKRYGLSGAAEASALMNDVRDNAQAAARLNRLDPKDPTNPEGYPISSNILGGNDSDEEWLVSGSAEILDQDGDFIRYAPFVIEGSGPITVQELQNEAAEAILGFIDKYRSELFDDGDPGDMHIGRITYSYAGKR